MSTKLQSKKCCYKGCSSTSYNSKATFFNFPKEGDKRYRQWVKLSQCDPEIKWKVICSDHFDLTKFMSFNQRRKMLLNTAMPFEYVPSKVENYNFSISTDQEDILITETDSQLSDEEGSKDTFSEESHFQPSKKPRNDPPAKESLGTTTQDILDELDQSMMEEMAPHVSTFIFKGEEYVQMPKKDYLAEKDKFLSEIRKYKGIFEKLKSQINSFDDS
ncbi:hypothetical protein ACFFRR_000075 [Megaselia abdita]